MSFIQSHATGHLVLTSIHNCGIYINWEECKEQIHQYPGALYKKFYTKQQAEDYINEENYDEANILKERKGKSIFKHVRGHSGIYENEQADRLAYLGSQKTDVYKKLALLYYPDKNVKKSEKERQQAKQKFIEI
ncbi:27994_t:CDS:2 [Gigaspora margarita]|uniref:27994_t:CDS:1 n=1 Tax=Gigaspora margarita TaxID=4874 RepID=A0ABN7US56_GIGMA|nr:27994_t:CDS:2 [Gigaspora margarita]